MTAEVQTIEQQARDALLQAADEAALEEWRVQTLGRSGALTRVLRSLGDLPADERRAAGQAANAAKTALEAAFEERREALRRSQLEAQVSAGAIDVTLPGRPLRRGNLHPVTQTRRDILAALTRMGFTTIEGPEVELDDYNFGALRIPPDHPARDMWDTFWIDHEVDGERPMLLRTHTSPMQIRYMETHQPPIRIAIPGRCYRYEATDATHEWMMQQIELLVIDEGASLADLKGTLLEFARQVMGARNIMLRNSYFPFVEPGVEVAVDIAPTGAEEPNWLEVLGAGMVHPEIISNAGYDPERYTGFAAGMGVERIAMIRYGIDDIRNFYANDLRFLSQF